MSVTVPTLAETSSDFIGPLNPHVGSWVRLAPGARGVLHVGSWVRLAPGARAVLVEHERDWRIIHATS
jgi:hypothetical protein